MSRRDAKIVSKQIKMHTKSHQRPYKCRVCGNYHLYTLHKDKGDTDECV
ncbi:hypothetical protein LCGC14_1528390 [marine sediment metagenome]|uniref:Uncharacterized protein n=1 Tax=marine sediment metagenome TaxID=412755 RepID=A0A0F9LXK9_9ZZZZ